MLSITLKSRKELQTISLSNLSAILRASQSCSMSLIWTVLWKEFSLRMFSLCTSPEKLMNLAMSTFFSANLMSKSSKMMRSSISYFTKLGALRIPLTQKVVELHNKQKRMVRSIMCLHTSGPHSTSTSNMHAIGSIRREELKRLTLGMGRLSGS